MLVNSLVHFPGNRAAQLLCSVRLHVLRQALEACSLRLRSQGLQQLLCMRICVLAVAAYVLHHHQVSVGHSKHMCIMVLAVAAYILHHHQVSEDNGEE